MVGATACWGASSAIVAEAGFRGAFSFGVVAAAAALTLGLVALLHGEPRLPPVQTIVLLGVLEAVNIAAYFEALRLGPTAPIVAVHLTSPLIILFASFLGGSRRVRKVDLAGGCALVLGIVVLAANGNDNGRHGSNVLAALGLAALSACAVALLILAVARLGSKATPVAGAASQLGVAAVLLGLGGYAGGAPITITWEACIAGAVFLGPGFALYWYAAARLPPPTTATLGLLEALFAAVVAAAVFSDSVGVLDALSAGLIAIAIALQRDYAQVMRRAPPRGLLR